MGRQEVSVGKFKNKKSVNSFSRPVATGSSEVHREWRNVEIRELAVGDIVAGHGRVNTIFESCDSTYYLVAGESTARFFAPDKIVYAFVKKG